MFPQYISSILNMAGGLLELIANNSNLNIFITGNPQVTFFKRLYRRHTPFALENINIPFKSSLNFGTIAEAVVSPSGDLINRMTLVIQTPAIRAAFLRSKAADLIDLIRTSKINDDFLSSRLIRYINSNDNDDHAEFGRIMEYIDNKIREYNIENGLILKRIELLRNFKDRIGSDDRSIPFFRRRDQMYYDYNIFKQRIYTTIDDSPVLRMLIDIFTLENILETPLLDTNNLIDSLLYSDLFPRLLKSHEFIVMDWIDRNRNMTDKINLDNESVSYHERIPFYQSINDYMFSDAKISEFDYRNTDVYHMNRTSDVSDIYGSSYHNLMSSYTIMQNIINTLSKTIPIVIIKAFKSNANYNKDIADLFYSAQIDPNYKLKFLIELNRGIDHNDSGSNNEFVKFVNENAIIMFDDFQRSMNLIFSEHQSLFSSLSRGDMTSLYYNYNTNNNDIYGYVIQANTHLFNLNPFYFYFFKYLNSLDPTAYASYLLTIVADLTDEEVSFIINMMTLLQRNIDFYMRDIAVYLNSIFTPGPDEMINMNQYSPTIQNNHNLITTTLIFYRGQIPSVAEMFEFIFDFINNITIQQINQYLNVNIRLKNSDNARRLVSELYRGVYDYFDNGRSINNYVKTVFDSNTVLSRGKNQMSFYFSSEKAVIRSINHFYQRILEITGESELVGSTTRFLMHLITSRIKSQNDIYYRTTALDRFIGKNYEGTNYIPRFYKVDVKPTSDQMTAPRIPYGVPFRYYDNLQTSPVSVYLIPYSGISTSYVNAVNTNEPKNIDYYRIRNSFFINDDYRRLWVHNVPVIEEMLLRSVYAINSYIQNPSRYNTIRLKETLNYLSNNITDLQYNGVDICSYFDTILNRLDSYLTNSNDTFIIQDTLMNMILHLQNLYNSGSQIVRDCVQYLPYSRHDLHRSNEDTDVLINENISISEVIQLLKENFRSRYFYYARIRETLIRLKKYIVTDETSVADVVGVLRDSEILSKRMKSLRTLSYAFNGIVTVCNILVKLSNYDIGFLHSRLKKVEQFIVAKESIITDISRYLKGSVMIDPSQIAIIASNHSINCSEFRIYIEGLVDKSKHYVSIINDIYDKLDHFLLKHIYHSNEHYLSEYIKTIFPSHILKYFKFVENKYLPHILKTLLSLTGSDININTMMSISIEHFNSAKSVYRNFSRVSDMVSFIIDSRFEFSETLNRVFIEEAERIQNRIDQMREEDRLEFEYELSKIADKRRNDRRIEIMKQNRINMIIDALNRNVISDQENDNNKGIISNTNEKNYRRTDYFMDILDMNRRILDSVKDFVSSRLLLINDKRREVIFVKNQLYNIIYRNKDACCAWIRRLGHYLVKQVIIRSNEQVLAMYDSDWMETNSQLTLPVSQRHGYSLMIGDVPAMNVFNTFQKDAYTIYLPLIFWFNKNPSLSIPLVANIHTEISIEVSLRNLSDVFYKEQYSSYIDPITGEEFTPSITNAYLVGEYVYLSTQERSLFTSKYLEYLIEEVHYDGGQSVSARNTEEVYLVGEGTITYTSMQTGIKTTLTKYDPIKGVYTPIGEIKNRDSMSLLEKRDMYLQKRMDRHGFLIRSIINSNDLSEKGDIVHMRRVSYRNYFFNPTKYMTVLIRMDKHIDTEMRIDDSEYFYGEKQYDNFGLYSYFSHRRIIDIKCEHYAFLRSRLMNVNDMRYGFLNVINMVMNEYFDNPAMLAMSEKIQILKEIWLSEHDFEYKPHRNYVKLIEDLMTSGIDFNITNRTDLITTIQNIYSELQSNYPVNEIIIGIFEKICPGFRLDDFEISKTQFKQAIVTLLHENVDIMQIETLVNRHYTNHNVHVIIDLVNDIDEEIYLEQQVYDYKNIISYYHNLKRDKISSILMDRIRDVGLNDIVKNMYFKEIIYSTIRDRHYWSPNEVSCIASEMNRIVNRLIDEEEINIITYNDYLIPNPKVNPLVRGYLTFNGVQIMPNFDATVWNCVEAYKCFPNIPNIGVNVHSWSLYPLSIQPSGSVNLGKIDDFTSTYDLRPEINDSNPAKIHTHIMSYNIWRVMSGMNGKAWENE